MTAAVVLTGLRTASAHEGPPFPIILDEPLAGYVVSVWADPDIGEARFFIIVETPQGGMPENVPQVSLWVEPVDGRLERVTYETERESLKNQMQFAAAPYFDQRDMWTVGIEVAPPEGQAETTTTEVESTPPGYGPWDLAIYLFPFLLLGGLWVYAIVRRVRKVREYRAELQAEHDAHTDGAVTDRQPAGITAEGDA
jgi:hypothetical protein